MCKECGGKKKDMEPAPQIFSRFPPFPKEGILGMYPIHSTCKKEIAEHMARFQAKLIDRCRTPEIKVRMRDLHRGEKKDDEKTVEVKDLLEKIEMEVDKLKHELAVEMIKRKYEKQGTCPCPSTS